MKLKRKERHGSQVKKTYHAAQRPYQRLRCSSHLSTAGKQRLAREYGQLNPAELKRKIERIEAKLLKLAANARPPRLHPRQQHGWTNDFIFAKRERPVRVDFHLRQ